MRSSRPESSYTLVDTLNYPFSSALLAMPGPRTTFRYAQELKATGL